MPVRDIGELTPDVRRIIEDYLSSVEAGFCEITRDIAEDALDDVRDYLFDRLGTDSSVEDARAVIAELGEPDEYAARLCAEVGREMEDVAVAAKPEVATPRGRLLGMPYDAKAPTAKNLESRMWNPEDPRIFTPRLIGLGWTINFAAIAVKLGFIRPDDEDEPFALVPEFALWAALFVPIVLCGGVIIAIAVSWPTLPEQVAVHWGANGQPDGFASPPVALLPIAAFAVLPAGYALWTFVSGRSKAARAVTTAFSTTFVVISAGITAAILVDAAGMSLGWYWPWLMVLACFAVPFAILFVLSRLGHAREIRHDLESERS